MESKLPKTLFRGTYQSTKEYVESLLPSPGPESIPELPPDDSNLEFLYDGRSEYFKTISNDDIVGGTIDSVEDRAGNKSTMTSSGTKSLKPFAHGHYMYFWQNDYLVGNQSDWNLLHSGDPFTLVLQFRIFETSSTAIYHIANSIATSGANRGIALYYDNRSAASRSNALVLQISNGGSNLIAKVMNDVIDPNDWNDVVITFDGATYVTRVNGTQVDSTAKSVASGSSSDATYNVAMGIRADNLTSDGLRGAVRQFFAYNVLQDASTITEIETYLSSEDRSISFRGDANVYMMSGQSNLLAASNTGLASELINPGARVYYKAATSTTGIDGFWQPINVGVNQNPFSGSVSEHGPEPRFGYNMNQLSSNKIFILKYAVGGTALIAANDSGAGDWDTASSNELYDNWKDIAYHGLKALSEKLGYTPVIRGYIWNQGEEDCNAGSDPSGTYATKLSDLIKGKADYINDTIGLSTAKMRVSIARTSNNISPARPFTNEVRTDQEDVGDNFLTDNPSYASRVLSTRWYDVDSYPLSDGVHYTIAGQNSQGVDLSNYYDDFLNE